jgi:hypothetical protein
MQNSTEYNEANEGLYAQIVASLRPSKIVRKMAAIFEPRIHANER